MSQLRLTGGHHLGDAGHHMPRLPQTSVMVVVGGRALHARSSEEALRIKFQGWRKTRQAPDARLLLRRLLVQYGSASILWSQALNGLRRCIARVAVLAAVTKDTYRR